jgi:hypothetical protein
MGATCLLKGGWFRVICWMICLLQSVAVAPLQIFIPEGSGCLVGVVTN